MSGTLLVTGAAGYLGQRVLALARTANSWPRIVGTVHHTAANWGDTVAVDLGDQAMVAELLNDLQPAAIIHTAAATPAMGRAMTERALWQVNVAGSATLARWSAQRPARLVHVSSDAIWGGREQPYTEEDVPAPITPYGASKAAAEAVVQALNSAAVLARTSLIYGWQPPDPNTVMALEMLQGRRAGFLFTDEIRCPIFVDDLARALLELAQSTLAGALHVVGEQAISRYDFGAALLCWHGQDPQQLPGGSTSASGIRRPSRVVVQNARTQMLLRTRLRGVNEVTAQEVSDETYSRCDH